MLKGPGENTANTLQRHCNYIVYELYGAAVAKQRCCINTGVTDWTGVYVYIVIVITVHLPLCISNTHLSDATRVQCTCSSSTTFSYPLSLQYSFESMAFTPLTGWAIKKSVWMSEKFK